MKYILLIHHDEEAWERKSESEQQRIYGQFRQLRQQLMSSRQYVDGSQLHPTTSATSVRVRDGKRLLTDGPFAETREQLGGYFVIDANDLDEAIGIAARIPAASWGTIEVRRLMEAPVTASTTRQATMCGLSAFPAGPAARRPLAWGRSPAGRLLVGKA
jgi:hypothetical protein